MPYAATGNFNEKYSNIAFGKLSVFEIRGQ